MAKKDEGYLLDGSGERVKSGSGDYARSGSYDDEKVTENRMKAAENKLAQDVQKKLKDDSDSARVSKDAEKGARAPTSNGMDESDRRREAAESAPKRQDSVKTKPSVVTKEQLAKSGFDNLRDYMNAQKGLKRRDGSKTEKTPSKTTTETKPAVSKSADKPAGLTATAGKPASKPAVSESYRSEGANKAKPAASAGKSMFQRIAEKPTLADRIRQRGEDDLKSRGMKAGGSVKMAKGSSINGIAKRGLTKCKTV